MIDGEMIHPRFDRRYEGLKCIQFSSFGEVLCDRVPVRYQEVLEHGTFG